MHQAALTYREPNRTFWGAKAGWGAPVALVSLVYSKLVYELAVGGTKDLITPAFVFFLLGLPLLLLFGTMLFRRKRLVVTEDEIRLPYRKRGRSGRVVTQVRLGDVSKAEMIEGFDPVPSSLQGIHDTTRASDPGVWRCELTLTDGTLVTLDYLDRACKPIACREALIRFVEHVWARRS